jgi:monovalent cation:H+ antiporter, CPA1 family
VTQTLLPVAVVGLVLVAGFFLSRILDRAGVTAMIAVSIAGIVIGALVPAYVHPSIGPVALAVFLPALIFEAAWDADVAALRRAAIAIAVLAVPGVFVTAAIVAGAAVLSGSLAWPAALVLGALVAATDPVSVLETFRRLALPQLLVTIVEGESVANDGVALALVQSLVPLAIVTMPHPPVPVLVVQMLAVSGGGIIAGILVGVALGLVIRLRLATSVRIALTIAAAYGAFAFAAGLGLSGIFATAAAGITLRSMAQTKPGSSEAVAIDRTWDAIALGANAIVFALVGLTLRLDRFLSEPLLLLFVVAGVAIARIVLAYWLVPLRGLTDAPRAWRHAIALAGLRGGLSLAIAIGLPAAMPAREIIRDATFVVVFVTLIVQGSLVAPLLRRLALTERASATSGLAAG